MKLAETAFLVLGLPSEERISAILTPQPAKPQVPHHRRRSTDKPTTRSINRDMITATVGNNTSAAFGWGLSQTISGVTVNEAARTSYFDMGIRTDDMLVEYPSSGVFVHGEQAFRHDRPRFRHLGWARRSAFNRRSLR